jgi:hypothetical protein
MIGQRTTEWLSCVGGWPERDGGEGEDGENEDEEEEEDPSSSKECDIICR